MTKPMLLGVADAVIIAENGMQMYSASLSSHTIEQTVDVTDLRGGRGNKIIGRLKSGNSLTVTLEDLEQNNEDSVRQVKADVEEIKQNVCLLIDSDKDDIRAWITDKYHYFMKLKYIDDFTLDCLERRFKSYKQEGGNTYVDSMMEELRRLPRKNLSDSE